MTVHSLNPLEDLRWTPFVERHRAASAFHTRGWLQALQRTYGYKPVAFTTSAPGQDLANAVVFCHVSSWITGSRLVSLPFSDHCDPLVDDACELQELLAAARCSRQVGRYLELRPLDPRWGGSAGAAGFQVGSRYYSHQLPLADAGELFANFHKDCVQRKIRRAEREQLRYERGQSEGLLRSFYEVFSQGRRRLRLPPQPVDWFRNVLQYLGHLAEIHIASHEDRPVACVMTLRFNHRTVYKYGASLDSANRLGPMQFLLWQVIRQAVEGGDRIFDMGRSDLDQPGLITFKDRWGARKSELTYWRFSERKASHAGARKMALVQRLFAYLPQDVLNWSGRMIYRHIG